MNRPDDAVTAGMAASRMGELTPGAVFNGRYRIDRVLGAGGMGMVYQVLDTNTDRERALKVMLPTVVANAELRNRFAREAKVAAKIDSEHIAEVVDAGIEASSGAPFIVMELLKGIELEGLVVKRGALPIDEVVLYLSQAALALDKAHARGIVHRDLKPENIYVTYRDDGSPRIKLLDFGIAKVVSESMSGSQTKGMLGTPLYMAPEQAHGKFAISSSTDTYALAQIAYTALVGEAYYEPENEGTASIYQLIVALMDGPVERASQRAARRKGITLPQSFDSWFARASARDPAGRFERSSELVQSLAQAMGAAVSIRAPMPSAPPMTPTPLSPMTAAHQPWPGPQPPTFPSAGVPPPPTYPSGPMPAVTPPHQTLAGAPVTLPSHMANAPTVASTARPNLPGGGMSTRTAVLIGGGLFVLLTGLGSAAILWRNKKGDASAETSEPDRDRKTRKEKVVASDLPSASSSAVASTHPLVGRWQSKSQRKFDAVWKDNRIEFRIQDASQFSGGWATGEWRFALEPIAGQPDNFRVYDNFRPNPPGGYRYTSGASATCVHVYDAVQGRPLMAQLSIDHLEVDFVEATYTANHFLVQGVEVTGCQRLETGTTTRITSGLDRVKE